MLTSADFVVIALYAVLMTWIGIQATSVDAYFAADHSLPWWMAAISHHRVRPVDSHLRRRPFSSELWFSHLRLSDSTCIAISLC